MLRAEFVIAATGVVRERESKTDKIPTGAVEVYVQELKLLAKSETPPFAVSYTHLDVYKRQVVGHYGNFDALAAQAVMDAKKRHPVVEERMKKLSELAEKTDLNRVEMGGTDIGIITSGTSYQYVKEVFGDKVSVYKLGLVHPLPVESLREFASKVKKLYVVEELDGVIETHCKANGIDVIGKELFSNIGEFSQKTIAAAFGLQPHETYKISSPVPVRPPMMCAGCPHRGMYYVPVSYTHLRNSLRGFILSGCLLQTMR